MKTIRSILDLGIIRLMALFRNVTAELPECVSMLFALSWAIPLTLNVEFLDNSLYLRALSSHVDPHIMAVIAWVLFAYQFTCCLLGGKPSHFLREDSYRVAIAWLTARQAGMWVALYLWASMSYLIRSTGYITPGVVLHGGLSCLCLVGLLMIRRSIAIERESARLVAIHRDAEQLMRGDKTAWTRYSLTPQRSGHSLPQ